MGKESGQYEKLWVRLTVLLLMAVCLALFWLPLFFGFREDTTIRQEYAEWRFVIDTFILELSFGQRFNKATLVDLYNEEFGDDQDI